jgi:hypothetical protein
MLRQRLVSWCALVGVGTSIAAACTGETDNVYATVENWECFEVVALGAGGGEAGGAGGATSSDGSGEKPGCECFGVDRHQSVEDPRPKVNRCGASSADSSGWQCCYAWRDGDEYQCRCEDAPADQQAAAYCASGAALVEGEVVERCPPTPLDNVTYCAFEGESCDPDYLDEQGLSGCCKDLACVENQHQVPVCVAK